MLRVGLTGGLGSGKSTVAKMFAAHGASVLSADDIARDLMQPGQSVYAAVVERFGPAVIAPDGSLDRPALARIAFADGRVEELNAIVHPATIARQQELIAEIAAGDPHAVILIESALIFETQHGGEGGWPKRFDKIILVTAPEHLKIERFIARTAPLPTLTSESRSLLEAEARRRLARQINDNQKASRCDFVVLNDGSIETLSKQVDAIWPSLLAASV
jgi:dephospho-CoA kinase